MIHLESLNPLVKIKEYNLIKKQFNIPVVVEMEGTLDATLATVEVTPLPKMV